MSEPTNIAEFKTEAQRVAELKAALAAVLDPVCAVMNAAKADGLTPQFGIQLDAFGRYTVQGMTIFRVVG